MDWLESCFDGRLRYCMEVLHLEGPEKVGSNVGYVSNWKGGESIHTHQFTMKKFNTMRWLALAVWVAATMCLAQV